MTFLQKIEERIKKTGSLLCIGLDSDFDKLPPHIKSGPYPQSTFNKAIIDATNDLTCCYKANLGFYLAGGVDGLREFMITIDYLKEHFVDIPFILDAKVGDIGNTSEQYAKEAFDVIGADAVTVNPYHGFDGIEPFLKRKEKGVIIVCRTSNPGASDFQDTEVLRIKHIGGVAKITPHDYEPLYMHVARRVAQWNKQYKNCMLVVGATSSDEIKRIREVAGDMYLLVPGIGAQGGDLQSVLAGGLTKNTSGLLIHAARSIIYTSSKEDFAAKARGEAEKLRDQISRLKNQ